MRKNCLLVVCFLISVMLFSVSTPTPMLNAIYVSVQWGHLVVDGQGNYDQTEYNWESMTSSSIYSDFGAYWNRLDAYWGASTGTGLVSALQFCQNTSNVVDWATTWWLEISLPTQIPHGMVFTEMVATMLGQTLYSTL
jgi:hypothetical protein